jgi:heme oxygenase
MATTVAALDDNETTLTERMRRATKEIHDKSDILVNLKLSLVITSKPLYAEAISLFWPIYVELETLLEKHKHHKHLKLIHPILSILRCGKRFEEDMKSLLGSDDLATKLMQRRGPSHEARYSPPELQAYVDRLRHLSKDNPTVLIAYIYTMYSAIMAGGAIIRRIVKRAFGLTTDHGVQLFVLPHCDDFPNSKAVRNALKKIINEDMQLSEEEKQLIIKEAQTVFQRNNALVATVKDTAVFTAASRRCLMDVGGIAIAVAVIIAAVFVAFYKRT